MRKSRSILIRIVGLLALVVAGGFLLGPPLAAKRKEKRIRTMLLEVQRALQNYHVAEEIYPRRMMGGGELIAFLRESGFVDGSILNPWTQQDYKKESEADWLRYRTDSLAETYELIVYRQGTEEIHFRLDSSENQSLE